MFAKVILLIGLPGSGKTTWGKAFLQANPQVVFVDDMSMLTNNAKDYLAKIKTNSENSTLIIADVHFCQGNIRKTAEHTIKEVFPTASLEMIFFENNPEKCLNNIQTRMTKGDTRLVTEMVRQLSKVYFIPENQTCLKIYQ